MTAEALTDLENVFK